MGGSKQTAPKLRAVQKSRIFPNLTTTTLNNNKKSLVLNKMELQTETTSTQFSITTFGVPTLGHIWHEKVC